MRFQERFSGWVLPAAAAVAAMVLPSTALACATCFGDLDSEMVKGAKAGVIFLAVVVYGVVLTMGGVVGFWVLKARRLERLPQPENDVEPSSDRES